jgi:hypothetical protein
MVGLSSERMMSVVGSGLSIRNRYFLIFDIILFVLSASLSFVIRLETFNLRIIGYGPLWFLALALPIKLTVFLIYGMYSRYCRLSTCCCPARSS